MKYPTYPKYRDSGVQWLGEVPEHWEIRPIKFLVSTPVTDGPHETPEILTEGIPFVSAEAINNGKINFDKIRGYISEEDHQKYSKKYKPEKGDIFMVKSGATTGRVAMVEKDIEFNIWSPLAAIRPDIRFATARFLYHYLHSKEFQTAVQLGWNFGTQQNIGMGVIQNLAAPKPTLAEQTAIANFLDRETGRIDTLVAKKRRLIGLLDEKRTALISRTVTRGLPADVAREFGLEPHTRFKDSGIDWLGEVPEEWEVKRLGYLTRKIGSGKTPSGGAETYVDEGVMFLRSQNVYDEGLRLADVVYIDEGVDADMAISRVKPRDVLLNITGASLGRTCIVPESLANANVNQHVCIIRLSNTDQSAFIAWVMKSAATKAQIQNVQTGAAREGLNFEQIANLIFTLPPLPEQTATATYLDRGTAKIDQLKKKVEEAIARLQEYRTVLITASVTGKIDVRKAAA